MRGARLVALLAALVLAVSACRLEAEVGVDVEDDGSGTVEVGVGLDDDALRRIPDLEQQLRLDDLIGAGWTITGPAEEDDGLTWVRASKPFATPQQAGEVLAEVAGEDGPFQDFRVSRDRSFARTTYRFDGTVDFSGGIEQFSDEELTERLDGEPFGQDIEALGEQVGTTLDRIFQFRVAVRLPGDVEANAPTVAENGAVWRPRLSDTGPALLEAESRRWNVVSLAWAGVAVLAGVALVLVLLIRLAVRARTSPKSSE